MAQTTVKKLAEEVGIPVERLVSRLEAAGVSAESAEDELSGDDKLKLLRYLRDGGDSGEAADSEGSASSRRVSLRRKSTSELKLSGSRGSAGKTVNVEVRKRRTYVNRGQQAKEQAEREEAERQVELEQEAEAEQAHEEEDNAQDNQPDQQPEEAASNEQVADVDLNTGEASESSEPVEAAPENVAHEQSSDPSPSSDEADMAETEAETVEPASSNAEDAASESGSQEESPTNIQGDIEVDPQVDEPSEETSEPEAGQDESSANNQSDKKKSRPKTRAERMMEATRSRTRENLKRASESHGRTAEDEERERTRKERQELHVAEGKQGRRKKKKKDRKGGDSQVDMQTEHGFAKPTQPVVHDVEIPETITVGDLAQRMAVKANELIKKMMKLGVMATINQTVDQETAVILVEEMGHNPKTISEASEEEAMLEEALGEEQGTEVEPRAPVITVMGHVDHGKTSLLDYIRRTKVATDEAGGITQHIGAYHVAHEKGDITFIDTPGHAAFTRMRARGAEITDVAVLVIAADDGVMPQTRESIQHARAADVPIVVAVTKSDVSSADIDRVKSDLSAEEVISEDWGGDIQVIPVSSATGAGIDDLLDAISLQAEILELTAPSDASARGVVIESSLEKGRGPVATVLVRTGTLRQGDYLLAGSHHGRVRALFDERGEQSNDAGPSTPVEVLGLSGTPNAGDETLVVANERKAREIAEQRDDRMRENKLAQQQAARLEEVFSRMGEEGSGETKDLNLLVKGDVQGSVEALTDALKRIPSEEVRVRIVASGVGGLSESDVELAIASEAIMIGFNIRADANARKAIQDAGIDVRYYSVIYEAIQDVTDAISGLLGTKTREDIQGLADVREVFRSSRLGAVAGCLIEDGAVSRGLPIRVLRDNVVIYEGELESLRRHRDDVNRVEAGTECGIGVKNYNDVKVGDQIECFQRVEVQRSVATEASV